ncbi:conserved hypothetical protein, partial [Ricinus communis]
RQRPLHHRRPVAVLGPLHGRIRVEPFRRALVDLDGVDALRVPAVFAVAVRLAHHRLQAGIVGCDPQRPAGRHQQAHEGAVHWHRPAHLDPAGDLALEHGVVAVQAECIVDDVADAHVVQQYAGGLAAVIDQVVQFGLTLQQPHVGARQLGNHLAGADDVDRVQGQVLVGRVETDGEVGHFFDAAAVQRLAGHVHIGDLAVLIDPRLHVAQQVGHAATLRFPVCRRGRLCLDGRHPSRRRAGFICLRAGGARPQQAQHKPDNTHDQSVEILGSKYLNSVAKKNGTPWRVVSFWQN